MAEVRLRISVGTPTAEMTSRMSIAYHMRFRAIAAPGLALWRK